jgi:hypothetical protein
VVPDDDEERVHLLERAYPTLFTATVRRELTWSHRDRFNTKKMEPNLIGPILYVTGEEADNGCKGRDRGDMDSCQKVWDGCIVAPSGSMKCETGNLIFPFPSVSLDNQ